MYDAHLRQEVLVIAPVLLIMADSPRHSELLNHLGSSARRYCRMCMVSTNKVYVALQVHVEHTCVLFHTYI